jgi:hypothetical protein
MRVVTNHADQNKKQKEIIMSNTKKETPRQGAAAQLFALVQNSHAPTAGISRICFYGTHSSREAQMPTWG